MLQVAKDSDVEEERLSESLVVSFFCLVRRFWNHTLTLKQQNQEEMFVIIFAPNTKLCLRFEAVK